MGAAAEAVGNTGQPSPEELLSLLDVFEKARGGDVGPVPDNLKDLVDNVNRKQGRPTEEWDVQEIVPRPGFVVKTTDQDGRKVFINLCSSDALPRPGGWGSDASVPPAVLQALRDLQADEGPSPSAQALEALRVPLACGELRPETDRQGRPTTAVDCVLHPDVLRAAAGHTALKAFLVELALSWVGQKHKLQLDARFKLPRMAYKGEVAPQAIKRPRAPLVTEMTSGGGGGGGNGSGTPAIPQRTQRGLTAAMRGADGDGGGGGARAAARAGAAASEPASTWKAAPPPPLQRGVQCEGCPVHSMHVTVHLPQGSSAPLPLRPEDVAVVVSGHELRVDAPGTAPQVVALPFAADASAAAPALLDADRRHVRVRLPLLPVEHYVAALRAAAPPAFGSLPISHADVMELEP